MPTASQLIKAAPYDLYLLDIVMPGTSGKVLCRELATQTRAGIIMVSSISDDAERIALLELGADDYVVKPFNPRILLARVRAAQRMIQLRERVEESERSRLRQVAELGIMTRKLRSAARTDTLTQLPNRRYAMKRLKQEWESAVRNGRPLSVIMCDIDRFKRVNDGFGHDTGDVVLREVALTLQSHARASDVLCRLGGEEFLVICRSAFEKDGVVIAARIREAVEQNEIQSGGFDGAVTVSLNLDYAATGRIGQWLQVAPRLLRAGGAMGFVDALVTADGAVAARASANIRSISARRRAPRAHTTRAAPRRADRRWRRGRSHRRVRRAGRWPTAVVRLRWRSRCRSRARTWSCGCRRRGSRCRRCRRP